MACLASVMVIPFLRQSLQNVVRMVQGAGNHSLISCLMSTAQTVWINQEELLETVNRQTMYLDLVQINREMGMQQMMFRAQYTSLDEEVFTTRMKDLILTYGPAGIFGTTGALLAPYMAMR